MPWRFLGDAPPQSPPKNSPSAAVVIVVDAAQAYCPQFVHQIANGATVVGPAR
jgi:hypothetical protein